MIQAARCSHFGTGCDRPDMDWKTSVTISVTVLLAFTGYFASYLYNLRLAQRNDRLERVDKQLSDLYGPLLALVMSGTASWDAFRSLYRPGGGSFGALSRRRQPRMPQRGDYG